jgi:hypothetical protein
MKTKTVFSAITMLVISSASANAQGKTSVTGGLYLTSNDFQQQKLTYEIDCSNSKDKIKTNGFFGSSTGYVLSKGEKHEFNKNKVYGFRNCENKNYRFYNGEAYLLVDTADFYIYYQYRPEENIKGKGLIKKDEYFFSKNANDDLQLLTIENLKNSFPANHRFHYALDANFKSDKDLIAYDNYQKIYKVKYLYNESVK